MRSASATLIGVEGIARATTVDAFVHDVWDAVLDSAYGEVRGLGRTPRSSPWPRYRCRRRRVTDSSLLVIGAMVVGPEFGLIAALVVSLTARRSDLVARRALWRLRKVPSGFRRRELGALIKVSAGGRVRNRAAV